MKKIKKKPKSKTKRKKITEKQKVKELEEMLSELVKHEKEIDKSFQVSQKTMLKPFNR